MRILNYTFLVDQGTRTKPSGNETNEKLTVYLRCSRVYILKTQICSFGAREVLAVKYVIVIKI